MSQTPEVRHVGHVDADLKASHLRRLRRVEGQVRGIQQMVADDRYCPDVLVQLAAVEAAVKAVGREILRHHLSHCVADAVGRSPQDRDRVLAELLDLIQRHA